MKIVYDTQECGRCGGTGKFSYNEMHGDTCYGCNGTGISRTPDAKKAVAIITKAIEEHESVPASEIQPGDTIWDSWNRRYRVVNSISQDGGGRMVNGTLVPYISLKMVGPTLGVDPSSTVRRKAPWTQEMKDLFKSLKGVTITEEEKV